MRFVYAAIVLLISSISYAEDCDSRVSSYRGVSTKQRELARERCEDRNSTSLGEALYELFDDDSDDPEYIDVEIYREVQQAIKNDSLDCEVGDQQFAGGLLSNCGSSGFVKNPTKDRYRCRKGADLNVFIFSSGESFKRIAVIVRENGKAVVKVNCAK
jgi:hypothetical protein